MTNASNRYEAIGLNGRRVLRDSIDECLRSMLQPTAVGMAIIGPEGDRLILAIVPEESPTARVLLEHAKEQPGVKAWRKDYEL